MMLLMMMMVIMMMVMMMVMILYVSPASPLILLSPSVIPCASAGHFQSAVTQLFYSSMCFHHSSNRYNVCPPVYNFMWGL